MIAGLALAVALAQEPSPSGPSPSESEVAAKSAADTDFSDVVLVWPDKFARWRNTRWLVATEIVVPTGMSFAREENHAFRTFAWQAKAVIACDQDYKLTGRSIEVGCAIEEIGLQATSLDRFRTDRDKELVQGVLDSLDRRLSGATIQLQVNERGAVTNVDLEGIDSRNLRERQQVETLRLIVQRLLVPFHMKIPKSGMEEGQWVEFDSQLMSLPSSDGVRGHTVIVHYLNFYRGFLLVQDIGQGVVSVTPPRAPELEGGTGSGGQAADSSIPPEMFGGGTWTEDGLAYDLRMDGVSIYNVDNGVMEERVYSMRGAPSALNPSTLGFWYAGRIQLLGADDRPDVGPTRQVSYPNLAIQGLPAWLPVDPEIAAELEGFRPSRELTFDEPRKPKGKE